MKGKLIFGAGLALGFVLGSKSGRSAYDSLKSKGEELWQNPSVQEKVHEATDTVKDKAPEILGQATGAAKKAGSAAAAKLPGGHGSDPSGQDTSSTGTSGSNGTAGSSSPSQSTGASGSAEPTPAPGSGDDLRPPGV